MPTTRKFTEEDIKEINAHLKRDGIDFETSLSDDGTSITVERLEFGGCEDQDGALRSVINGYFRGKGQNVSIENGKIKLRDTKLLFFDIDGTLVNFQTQMPDSAKQALRDAQANGHKIFLCTGRGKAQIYPFLLNFGFDGIVAGAGAYVEYENKVLFHEVFGKDRIQKLMDLFTEYDITCMLQMTEGCVMSRRGMIRFIRSLGFPVTEEQFEEARGIVEKSLGKLILDDEIGTFPDKYRNTENLLYTDSPLSVEEMQQKAGSSLKVMPPSFSKPKPDQGEITLSDVSKPRAIRRVVEALGADMKDTVAFGDGANDVQMLLDAGCGVAMGNAIPEAKEAADFVTKDIDDDGILYAMRHLGLL